MSPSPRDGYGFDAGTGLAFASSGAGVLTITHEDAPNDFTVVQTAKRQRSGRTMCSIPRRIVSYVTVATTPGRTVGGK